VEHYGPKQGHRTGLNQPVTVWARQISTAKHRRSQIGQDKAELGEIEHWKRTSHFEMELGVTWRGAGRLWLAERRRIAAVANSDLRREEAAVELRKGQTTASSWCAKLRQSSPWPKRWQKSSGDGGTMK
jgi:hypothetical protein